MALRSLGRGSNLELTARVSCVLSRHLVLKGKCQAIGVWVDLKASLYEPCGNGRETDFLTFGVHEVEVVAALVKPVRVHGVDVEVHFLDPDVKLSGHRTRSGDTGRSEVGKHALVLFSIHSRLEG